MGTCISLSNNNNNNKNKERELLDKLYPKHISTYLLNHNTIDYKKTLDIHNNVIVLFADICGFTKISRNSNVEDVARFLHSIYLRVDNILDKYPLLQKIETIGDCVMIVSGLYITELTTEYYNSIYLFAIELNNIISNMKYKDNKLNIRIGIAHGPIASAIIGTKVPRFCLFGHTINFASRLQTSANIGEIHISEEFKEKITISNVLYNEELSELKGLDIIKTYYISNKTDRVSIDESCTEILRDISL